MSEFNLGDFLEDVKANTILGQEISEVADNDQRQLVITFKASDDAKVALITIEAKGEKKPIISFYILISDLKAQAEDY